MFRSTTDNGLAELTFDDGDLAAAVSDAETLRLASVLDDPAIKAAVIVIRGGSAKREAAVPPTALPGAVARATIPIAAVITGDSGGIGLALACASHFRFAADDCRIHFPAITEQDVLDRLLREAGISAATTASLLSGRSVSAAAAVRAGFIDTAADAGSIGRIAREFMISLTRNRTPRCIRAAMQSIRNGYALPFEEALHGESGIFDVCVRGMLDIPAAATTPDDRTTPPAPETPAEEQRAAAPR